MKQLSWIAAAALLASAWTLAGRLSDYSSSESPGGPPPAARTRPAPAQLIVTTPNNKHEGVAEMPAQDKSVATLSFSSKSYQQCRQYIENNYQRFNTLPQIALDRHWNVGYLDRLFRRYGNQSPEQYLLRLKMNQAARLHPQGKEQVM